MKILVFANFGMGLYKFRKELLQELVKHNNEVLVSFPQDEYVPLIKKIGCTYIGTSIDRRGTNPLTDAKLFLSYLVLLRKQKPDIVLTYTIKPNIYGGLACRILKIPYITNITGLGTSIENEGILKKLSLSLYNLGISKAKCVFFQNKSNYKFFVDNGIRLPKTTVIPGSGVNLEENRYEKYPVDIGKIHFLYVGRIMKSKGVSELLEVASQIKKKYPNVFFHLVGFSEEDYNDKLSDYSKNGIIQYHGQQEDTHSFMKEAHAIILPSHHEGMSNVLLEASSTGRPILASEIPGCEETFDEGISGFGFPKNNVSKLKETIIKFIELPYEQKKTMGISARGKMEREYDRNIVIKKYIEEINR